MLPFPLQNSGRQGHCDLMVHHVMKDFVICNLISKLSCLHLVHTEVISIA